MTLCVGMLFFSLKMTVKTHVLAKKQFLTLSEEEKAYHHLKDLCDRIILFDLESVKITENALTFDLAVDRSTALYDCDYFQAQTKLQEKTLYLSLISVTGKEKTLIQELKLLENIEDLLIKFYPKEKVLTIDFKRGSSCIEWTFFLNPTAIKAPS